MLKSKTDKIEKEFELLKTENPPLAALMEDLVDFVSVEFSKDVVMTHIFRSKADQKQIYAKESAQKQQGLSPHMFWQAVDIRDWIYTDDEKKKIGEFLKKHYDATNKLNKLGSGSKTFWLHKIKGQAMHFHIQYKGSLVYVFSQGAVIRARPQMNASATTTAVSVPVAP